MKIMYNGTQRRYLMQQRKEELRGFAPIGMLE
jgi:hypothetical protein